MRVWLWQINYIRMLWNITIRQVFKMLIFLRYVKCYVISSNSRDVWFNIGNIWLYIWTIILDKAIWFNCAYIYIKLSILSNRNTNRSSREVITKCWENWNSRKSLFREVVELKIKDWWFRNILKFRERNFYSLFLRRFFNRTTLWSFSLKTTTNTFIHFSKCIINYS